MKENKPETSHMRKVLKGCASPFNAIAKAIHGKASEHRHITACTIGACFGYLGVMFAHMHQHVIPTELQDFLGYGMHGLGITPILERILACFEVAE